MADTFVCSVCKQEIKLGSPHSACQPPYVRPGKK